MFLDSANFLNYTPNVFHSINIFYYVLFSLFSPLKQLASDIHYIFSSSSSNKRKSGTDSVIHLLCTKFFAAL